MNQDLIKILDNSRPTEIKALQRLGLSFEDAQDIYQEASIVVFQTQSNPNLTLRKAPEAYLHGVCHNLAIRRLNELKRFSEGVDDAQLDRLLALTEVEEAAPDVMIDGSDDEQDYLQLLERLLHALPERDFALLRGFYLEGKSMEELADEFCMASVEVARTTKCRIMNRLRVKAKQLLNEIY